MDRCWDSVRRPWRFGKSDTLDGAVPRIVSANQGSKHVGPVQPTPRHRVWSPTAAADDAGSDLVRAVPERGARVKLDDQEGLVPAGFDPHHRHRSSPATSSGVAGGRCRNHWKVFPCSTPAARKRIPWARPTTARGITGFGGSSRAAIKIFPGSFRSDDSPAAFKGRPQARQGRRDPTSANRATSSPWGAESHSSAATWHQAVWYSHPCFIT